MVALGLQCAIAAGAPAAWFSAVAFAAVDIADGAAKLPAFIADFRKDRHALTTVAQANIASAATDILVQPQPASFAELFLFVRGSTAEYIDASGSALQAVSDVPRFDYRNGYRQLLLEGPATNLFLNAVAPVTQTITVANASQYTVSCRGTGSILLSGAATGSVTQAAPLTFTASTTSLTLTVSGTLARAQVEAGPVASSFIQTGGSTAARSADICRLSPVGEALLQKGFATLLVKGQGISGSLGRLVGAGSGDEILRLNTAQTNVLGGTSLSISGVTTPLPAFGLCLGWNSAGRSGSYNGGAAVTDSVTPSISGQAYLGRMQAGSFAAGRYDSLTIWPFRATNTTIQSKSGVYV